MPIDVGNAHDLQALAQPVAQQTPWAQLPDAHSFLSAQNAPFSLRPHEFSLHTLPADAVGVDRAGHEAPGAVAGERRAGACVGRDAAPVALHVAGGV